MKRARLALAVTLASLTLAGCGGKSAAELRFVADAHSSAPGLSDDALIQAGHDFCDHRDDPDGGYKAISYVGDGLTALNVGLSAALYLCDG